MKTVRLSGNGIKVFGLGLGSVDRVEYPFVKHIRMLITDGRTEDGFVFQNAKIVGMCGTATNKDPFKITRCVVKCDDFHKFEASDLESV